MISEKGKGLIFLISQPRAGSTLLQRMLAAHPEINTTQEPAIALYPLYGLRMEGHEAEYDVTVIKFFQEAFLNGLPAGHDTYVAALRKMLTHLYNAALPAGDGANFLDKTPRYYFAIPELFRVFPEAHYILLIYLQLLGPVIVSSVRYDYEELLK